jgi:hypothetical protein
MTRDILSNTRNDVADLLVPAKREIEEDVEKPGQIS